MRDMHTRFACLPDHAPDEGWPKQLLLSNKRTGQVPRRSGAINRLRPRRLDAISLDHKADLRGLS